MLNKANITTILEEHQGFAWLGNDQCRVRGSFFDSDGNHYTGNAMMDYFGSGDTYDAFCALVAGANGVFSVIRKVPGECWLATDLVRSLPLFYCSVKSGWVISDRAEALLDCSGEMELNKLSVMEFRGTGYVTGNQTLVNGVHQVQAGEVVRLGKQVDQCFHHTYRTDTILEDDDQALKHSARQEMERAFTRMVRGLEGRTAVVPLSGGFDSRLIAVMLKKHRYRDVVCFTYGRKGNEEAARSEKVAKTLGFPWYFVEYNQRLIADYIHSPGFVRYYPWAANYTSMFFLQEYFAVQYLHDQELIPEDAVFIPGHSGDFLGGSQFAKHQLPFYEETEHMLAKRILEVKYHFERYNRTERKLLLQHIREQLGAKDKGRGNGVIDAQSNRAGFGVIDAQGNRAGGGLGRNSNEKALSWSIHEDWDLKEKLAKFNVNSVSTYTFFGYTFRLPYYDRELVDFYRDLPVAVKQDKSLYDDLLVNAWFIPYGVHFGEEMKTPRRAYTIARFRKRIKRILPRRILAFRPQRADLLYYREITAQLREDLLRRGGRPAAYGSKYNKMIIDWYLLALRDKISNRF